MIKFISLVAIISNLICYTSPVHAEDPVTIAINDDQAANDCHVAAMSYGSMETNEFLIYVNRNSNNTTKHDAAINMLNDIGKAITFEKAAIKHEQTAINLMPNNNNLNSKGISNTRLKLIFMGHLKAYKIMLGLYHDEFKQDCTIQ
jgi:hypothetical protein